MCCEHELRPASLCEELLQFRTCSSTNTQGPSRKASVASLTGSSVHDCCVRRKLYCVPGSQAVGTPGLPRRLLRRAAGNCCEPLERAWLGFTRRDGPRRVYAADGAPLGNSRPPIGSTTSVSGSCVAAVRCFGAATERPML